MSGGEDGKECLWLFQFAPSILSFMHRSEVNLCGRRDVRFQGLIAMCRKVHSTGSLNIQNSQPFNYQIE